MEGRNCGRGGGGGGNTSKPLAPECPRKDNEWWKGSQTETFCRQRKHFLEQNKTVFIEVPVPDPVSVSISVAAWKPSECALSRRKICSYRNVFVVGFSNDSTVLNTVFVPSNFLFLSLFFCDWKDFILIKLQFFVLLLCFHRSSHSIFNSFPFLVFYKENWMRGILSRGRKKRIEENTLKYKLKN